MFSTEGRTADDPTLKAALLSSSYACWRNKQNPYPVYLPQLARAALPRPLREMGSALERVRKRGHSAYGYVERAIERELRVTKDPYYAEFRRRCGVSDADRSPTEGETTDIDITFEDMTTVVTVRSRFVGVSRLDATHLLQLAQPWNWHNAVPTFFLKSTPVTFDGNGRFPYLPARQFKEPYLLLEHVEWEWTPGVSGGVFNILGISKLDSRDMSFVDTVVDEVLEAEEKEEEERRKARGHADATRAKRIDRNGIKKLYAEIRRKRSSELLSLQYKYELQRCIQSKFIASWEVGGLDTDDGTYRAVWIPTKSKDTGDFLLEVVKRVRYSQYGAVLPEVPTVLNLLAPAVVSMLMKQLGYEGIRDELARRRQGTSSAFANRVFTPPGGRARSVDQGRRAS